jgi:hypothetical protein
VADIGNTAHSEVARWTFLGALGFVVDCAALPAA